MDNWKDVYPLFYQTTINSLATKTLSHSYLFEYDSLENTCSFLKDFIKSILSYHYLTGQKLTKEEEKMCYQIDHDLYDDCIWIYPEGNWIKKEQMSRLQHIYQTKSLHNTFRIYVIVGAERLNTSSANTILKFLEEPSENIIALLLTTNRYQVLNTISSRCQFFNLKTKQTEHKEVFPVYLELVQSFEKDIQDALIDVYTKHLALFETKEKFIESIDQLKLIYGQALSNQGILEQTVKIDEQMLNMIKDKNPVYQLTKKISYLIAAKKILLTTNVNIKNYLDKFVLEFVKEKE